ncbi:MAG TPA: hypothetical protein VGR57_03805, partial [Ktedonobacterales bacterium]|nr:hypothetical protein [Ktedonobacterales bacterium]
ETPRAAVADIDAPTEAASPSDATAPEVAAAPAAAPAAAAPDMAPNAAPTAPPGEPAPVSGSRLRRTRTLADVVQPEYPPVPEDGEPPAEPAEVARPVESGAPSSPPRAAATTAPLAEVTAPPRGARSGPLRAAPSGPLPAPPSGPRRAAPSGPFGAHPSGPLPAAPSTNPPPQRPPATTARLAPDEPLRTVPVPRRIPRPRHETFPGPADSGSGPVPAAPPPAQAPLAARLLWTIQRGSPRLVLTAALGHVCVGLGLAVAASIVFLVSGEQGVRLLAIAALTLVGGIAGYALVATSRPTWAGALALVAAQLTVLGLIYSAIGPQVAVLLFAPAAAHLAQRMGGRTVAIICGAGAVMVYIAFVIVSLIVPAPVIQPTALLFFNLFAAIAGTGLLLVSLVFVASARERSEASARARLYELRLLRARAAELRERTEGDAKLLEEALTTALRGRGIEPVAAEGALSPVADVINDVADRLATLQKDREDRLRVEGAVRAVVRAVERGWLGLPWAWPEPSGTLLDRLVAYLRTPRPREAATPLPWGDEPPTFVPRPARGANSRPLEPRSDPNIARAFAAMDEQWDPWSER